MSRASAERERETMPVVARCERCGREFVTLGGSDRDGFPPLGWRPAGGWTRWRGDGVDETAPICGGHIVPFQHNASGG